MTFYYGWAIVAVSFLVMVSVYSCISTLGVFISSIVNELNFSMSEFSLCFTLITLAMTVVVLFMGKIVKKISIRGSMILGCVILGLGFVMFSTGENIMTFYLASLLIGTGLSLGTLTPVSILLNNWFIAKKGIIMGIVFAGSGVGGFFYSILSNKLIVNFGWRTALVVIGCIAIFIITPIVFMVIKDRPEDIGLKPYGFEEKNFENLEVTGKTVKEALGEVKTYLIILGLLIATLIVTGIQFHIPIFLMELGYSQEHSALIYAVILGILVVGKISLGVIIDKFGLKFGMTLSVLLLLTSLASAHLANSVIFLVIFGITYAFASCMCTVAPSIVVSEVFGKKDYGNLMSIINFSMLIGACFGPFLTGKVYDRTLNYGNVWNMYFVMGIVVLVLVVLSLNNKIKNNQEVKIENETIIN